jgi:hypothetical protein
MNGAYFYQVSNNEKPNQEQESIFKLKATAFYLSMHIPVFSIVAPLEIT